ncbi:DUF3617 domain-containing protein [Sphingomicrobium lutaoense]|uniref:DUF3617 domain-containing protein n=1 Tax=Sphingomicrobium lutaoense TaxID=515949 RepID=A0A839Z4H7_9SPHN|nr:DUF3617 domain-containing protein [Sphingomicrobium lutaoense]MBB3764512.1 hypothetical protein [Sphingomicrobium lutaoense]
MHPATLIAIPAASLLLASAAAPPRAGQWISTATIVDVSAPGMPAGAVAMMKGKPRSHSYCLTQKQVEEAPEEMFRQTEGQCQYKKFDMAGGKLDSVAVCTGGMGKMDMTMTGTYDATSYQSHNVMRFSGPQGSMTMTAHVTGKRTGNC